MTHHNNNIVVHGSAGRRRDPCFWRQWAGVAHAFNTCKGANHSDVTISGRSIQAA